MYLLQIVLIAVLVGGCKKDNPTESNTSVGQLDVIVLQVNTTAPIAGVVVTVGNISGTTGGDGKVSLMGVPTGSATLVATKSDYETYQSTITVIANQTTVKTIYLTSSILGTTLSGVITDSETNQAIQGAKITLAQQIDYSDSKGHYQIANVPQGTYPIIAEITGYIKFTGQVFLSSSDKTFDISLVKGSEISFTSITKDTTLKNAYSPIYVHSNMTVKKGVRLTIEPGVTIKFDDSKGLTQELGATMIAVGISQAPIVFTSTRNYATPGVWNGISIPGESSNQLAYIKVEYATVGLTATNTDPTAAYSHRLKVSQSIFQNCLTGVAGPLELTDVIISNNKTGATTGEYEGIVATNVKFSQNSVYGLTTVGTTNCPATLDKCTFENNETGANVTWTTSESGGFGIYATARITNCTFQNNSGVGLSFNGAFAYFKNNNFIGNIGYGFTMYSIRFNGTPYDIEYNYIAGNKGKNLSVVDITLDGSGGQYTTNISTAGNGNIGNPLSTPNASVGASWPGF
jgi:hypothetical protein